MASFENFNKKEIPEPRSFELLGDTKEQKWENLRGIVLGDEVCRARLRKGAKLVFGAGNLNADIFFCGEAPGVDEENYAQGDYENKSYGAPFVGKAGQKLMQIIEAMGLRREDVYISNIMAWRPEKEGAGNRAPTAREMAYCLPYLKAQIEIVKPKLIVALGMTATNGLLGAKTKLKMMQVRGSWQAYMGGELLITYHPSYLMQYASAEAKKLAWQDMLSLMQRLAMPISKEQRAYFI